MTYFFISIFLSLILSIHSPIPNWNIEAQSIDLLSSTTSYDYILYQKESYYKTVTLKKTITKSDGVINTQNYITIDSITKSVDFDDIDSHYVNKLGCSILICPRGKFHPYNFTNDNYIIPSGFEDKGGWDLRCYDHYQGYFFVFYLSNNGKNIFFKYDNDEIRECTYVQTHIYDFKLENGNKEHNYEYKFSYLRNHEDNKLYLVPGVLILNNDDNTRHPNHNSLGNRKYLIDNKAYTEGSFDSNYYFYFLTYNDISDFTSGYSDEYVHFDSKVIYESCVQSMTSTINTISPLSFTDNVVIQEMKFIIGTHYAYYKIYNSDKDKMYHGLINVKENKVLYNFDEEITLFIPNSSSEILAITSTSAYKVCMIKTGSSCSDSCSGGSLTLDPDGNKCQNGCDSGKVKLMPEGICINKDSCDEN